MQLTPFDHDAHTGALIRLLNQEAVASALPFAEPFTEEDAVAYIKPLEAEPRKQWLLAIEHNDQTIGFIGYGRATYRHIVQCYYWLDATLHGKGFGTQALADFKQHIFKATEFTRIQALVEPDNPASAKVLERNGFVNEGLLHNYFYHAKNQRVYDVHIYAVCKEE